MSRDSQQNYLISHANFPGSHATEHKLTKEKNKKWTYFSQI